MLYSLLRTYLRSYRHWLLGLLALQFLVTIAGLSLPRLNAEIIDTGVVEGDTAYILRAGTVMLAIALAQIVGTIVAVYIGARTSMGMGRDLRAAVFRRVGTFSSREVARFGAPSLITRTTNDVQQVQMLVLIGCTQIVTAPIMMAGGVVMALREDLTLSWLLLVCVPAMAVSLGLVISRMVPAFRVMQGYIDRLNQTLREQITGIRVVRAFVREPFETERFATANGELTDVALRVGRWIALIGPLVTIVFNLSSVAVLWFGGQRVDGGVMQIGSLTAFLAYLMQILFSMMMATFMLLQVPRAAVSAERIIEVLDTDSSVVAPASPSPPGATRLGVRFVDAGFSYPGASEPVLRGLDFTARPGQTTAIIGSTGAGKSTLLGLVARLFDVTAGEVSVDGVDVRQLDPEWLWSRIGLVPQRGYLFTGTVASNLRYGRPEATDEELWTALEIAQARDFVTQMSEGLATPIAQGGTNVSGGQRQRLAIARALLTAPDIFLFDDAFSALDLATDARLRRALKPVTQDATVLVVAQRVSTILDADQVIVLEDGAVVGQGHHEALLTDCQTYREIVESQLGGEAPV